MLVARSKITDRTLEPTDGTTLFVRLYNTSPFATAKDVEAKLRLSGPSLEGISLTPDDRNFGTILPGANATKEFNITTERAKKGLYGITLDLKYEATYRDQECEKITFVVGDD